MAGGGATCDTVGVIGPVVGIIANYQIGEALKILTGNGDRVSRTMLNVDLWTNMFTQLKVAHVREDGDCVCCGRRQFDYLHGKAGSSSTALCGRDAVQLRHRQARGDVDLGELAARLEHHGAVRTNEFMLRATISDNGNDYELTLFRDGRAIIKGTAETSVARSIYAKYIGG